MPMTVFLISIKFENFILYNSGYLIIKIIFNESTKRYQFMVYEILIWCIMLTKIISQEKF